MPSQELGVGVTQRLKELVSSENQTRKAQGGLGPGWSSGPHEACTLFHSQLPGGRTVVSVLSSWEKHPHLSHDAPTLIPFAMQTVSYWSRGAGTARVSLRETGMGRRDADVFGGECLEAEPAVVK